MTSTGPPSATTAAGATAAPAPIAATESTSTSRSQGSFSVNLSTTSAHPMSNGGTNGAPAAAATNGNGAAAAACGPTSCAPVVASSHHGASPPALVNKPTFLEDPRFRFLIMDAPNDSNLPSYMEVLKKRQVVVIARVCDPTYNTAPLAAQGIKVVEVPFADGDPPPQHVVDRWLALVDQVFKHGGKNTTGTGVDLAVEGIEKPAIAVHCVAGLGRAPVLVAIALVEMGMEPFDAIAFIRKKRRGAINARQLKYIEQYQPKSRAKGCCTIL